MGNEQENWDLLAYLHSPGASPPAAWEPEAFLTSLGEICNQRPHWSLLQLLTEVGGPKRREGGACVSLAPQSSIYAHSVASVLKTFISYTRAWAAGRVFTPTWDHPDSKLSFHPMPLPEVFPD